MPKCVKCLCKMLITQNVDHSFSCYLLWRTLTPSHTSISEFVGELVYLCKINRSIRCDCQISHCSQMLLHFALPLRVHLQWFLPPFTYHFRMAVCSSQFHLKCDFIATIFTQVRCKLYALAQLHPSVSEFCLCLKCLQRTFDGNVWNSICQ